MSPDPLNNGASTEFRYAWDDTTHILTRRFDGGSLVPVAWKVRVFNLASDTFERNSVTYIRGITVTLQIGLVSNNQVKQYIGLMNCPEQP